MCTSANGRDCGVVCGGGFVGAAGRVGALESLASAGDASGQTGKLVLYGLPSGVALQAGDIQ